MDIKKTLETVKDTLGFESQEIEDGIFIPSESSLRVAAPNKTDYDNTEFDAPYSGDKKILMLCTEEEYMTMDNGRKFSTGNQPIEMFVPILHFQKAGFEVDVFTPTGGSVKLEQWAMPKDDENVKQAYESFKQKLESPNSLQDFVNNTMTNCEDYAAIFIPGGHGAMLGLPEDANVGKLLRWGHDNGLYTLAICHGPAALLAANLGDLSEGDSTGEDSQDKVSQEKNSPESASNNANSQFIYKGYEIVAFPDVMDKHMPKMGYLPGDMPWYFNEKLEALGVSITNKLATGNTHQDRKLITGDGPLAANQFGKLAVEALLKSLR